jgi:hypothetical protein
MYRIVSIRGHGVSRSPVSVKWSGYGYRKMDVMTPKSTKGIIILSWSALIAAVSGLTHLKLPPFHVFRILEYDPVMWLKFRCSFAVLQISFEH